MDSLAGEAPTVDVIGVAPKCFNGDRESKEDAAVEGECGHMTHKNLHFMSTPVFSLPLYVHLQPTLITVACWLKASV